MIRNLRPKTHLRMTVDEATALHAERDGKTFYFGRRVNSIGLGLRLRYERTRAFAPYIGVQGRREFGGGRGVDIAVVFGVRLWF